MKRLSQKDAESYGIRTAHHEMDNGELRFRLTSERGSSYILTQSTAKNGWQNAHVHYRKNEFYLVEEGSVLIARLVDGELKIDKLEKHDSLHIPPNIPHNVLMSEGAILHTVKYGSQDEDWNPCPELDRLLCGVDILSLR